MLHFATESRRKPPCVQRLAPAEQKHPPSVCCTEQVLQVTAISHVSTCQTITINTLHVCTENERKATLVWMFIHTINFFKCFLISPYLCFHHLFV